MTIFRNKEKTVITIYDERTWQKIVDFEITYFKNYMIRWHPCLVIGTGLAIDNSYLLRNTLVKYSTLEQAVDALELFYQFLIKKFKENNYIIDYSDILSFAFPKNIEQTNNNEEN